MCIVQENISSTARAIRLKIQAFEKMSILSYSGENVADCATAVDETLEFIQQHAQDAKLPNDHLETLCGIFQKSTVEKFRMTVGLKLDKLEENPTAYDYKQLLSLFTAKYRNMLETGEWTATTPKRTEEALKGLSTRINKLEQKQNLHNKPSNKPTNTTFTSNKSKSSKQSGKLPWFLTPPKPGEPHKKDYKGKTYWWCPKHGKDGKTPKWVRHAPEDHDKAMENWRKNNAARKNTNQPTQPQASMATVPSSTLYCLNGIGG